MFEPAESPLYGLFSDSYGYLTFLSGIYGLYMSRRWGSFQSYMGKAVSFLSIGLLLQGFGQLVYSYYYLVLNIDVPYPSLGDVGFFGSIFMYILGVWFLGRASGVSYNLKSAKSWFLAILVPIVLLAISYNILRSEYAFDSNSSLVIFLDFGYPFGQAVYISLAVLIYLLTNNFLGGSMRPKILFIIFALFVQYVADFMFLYQVDRETWTAGGLNEFIYLLSYLLMTLALIKLESTFSLYKVKPEK